MPRVYTYAQDDKGVRRRVIIDMDDVPLDLKARRDLMNRKLQAGEYMEAPPTLAESTGEVLKGAYEAASEFGPSMAGIGIGAARGAQLGAPAGLWGVLAGSLGGAVIGGITGRAGTNVLLQRPEAPIDTITGGAKTGLESELYGLGFRAALATGKALRGVTKGVTGIAGRLATAQAVKAAQAHGIDLDASQMTGSPMLKAGRSFALRSGSRQIREFAEQQAGQVLAAGERLGGRFGPPTDVLAKGARFMSLMQARVKSLRQAGDDLYENFYQLVGHDTPVPLDDLYRTAFSIRGEQPVLESLRNPKLEKILTNIEDLKSSGFTHLPLKRVRDIQKGLGDIAFPQALEGTVTVDAPVGQAKALWGSTRDTLTTVAQQRGLEAEWEEANQFWSKVIEPMNDSRTIKAILTGEGKMASIGKQLFGDPSLLTDAKAVLTDDAMKLLQQHYWDEVFTASKTMSTEGVTGFNGRAFADRITKDQAMLRHLFSPEQLEGVNEFARATRLVGEATMLKAMDTLGVMFASGRGVTAGGAGLAALAGNLPLALGGAAYASTPFVIGHLLTHPTTAKMLAGMARGGRFDPQSMERVLRWGARAGVIEYNAPRVGPEAQELAR